MINYIVINDFIYSKDPLQTPTGRQKKRKYTYPAQQT